MFRRPLTLNALFRHSRNTACFCGLKGLTGPRGNEGAFLLRKGGEKVQHEWVNVRAKFRDQEGHLVSHQAAYEMNVPAETIRVGNRGATCQY
jgi:hypothetical protein